MSNEDKKAVLDMEITKLKALAYDVLANLEHLNADYKNKVNELQKQLENANKQISNKDQELRVLLQEEKK
jgi:ribosomal protein L16 Arg81 hydroxylase